MSLTQINKAGLDEIALDHVFTIGASGSSAYTFQGEGLNGTVNNPTLYLTRGKTYRFENGSGGHPIRIQSTSGASGTAYNTGVTNNAQAGTVIVEVQHDAPDVLYYQCTSHAAMNGILYITGALADGGVTTAKIADDAVTQAKIADNAVVTATIADGVVNSSKLANNSVTTTKIADNQIITAKIADNAVNGAKIAANSIGASEIQNSIITNAKLADQAVTLAKLEHGTSSNDGKFLRANNGADPTYETVNTDLVADTSPQLGGHLESNGYDIKIADGDEIKVGTGNDLLIYHAGDQSYVQDNGVGDLTVASNSNIKIKAGDENSVICNDDGSVELYHDNTKVFETGANRIFAKARFNINADGINSGHDLGFGQWDGSNHRIEGDSNRPMFITSYNSSGIKFGASSAVKATVTSNGLTFNGDTAAANALDDYEEGSWTPQIRRYENGSFGTAASMTSNGTVQRSTYTKIGNVVTLYLQWDGFQQSNANYAALGGLPYNTTSSGGGGGTVGYTNAFTNNQSQGILVGSDSDNMYFYINGTAWNAWSTSSNRAIYLQVTYLTT